jgi:hypothetical protein
MFIRSVLGAFVGQVFAGSAGARGFVVGLATGVWVGQNYNVPNVKQEFQRLLEAAIVTEQEHRKRK